MRAKVFATIALLCSSIACRQERRIAIVVLNERAIAAEHPITVEAGAGGVLDCAYDALGGDFRHSSTADAIGNLATQSAGKAVIVGHATSGVLCTGGGAVCDTVGWKMAHTNTAEWSPQVTGLKTRFDQVRVIGCYVGAGADGMKLLNAIEKEVGAPVLGSTCRVYCDKSNRRLIYEPAFSQCWRQSGQAPDLQKASWRQAIAPSAAGRFPATGAVPPDWPDLDFQLDFDKAIGCGNFDSAHGLTARAAAFDIDFDSWEKPGGEPLAIVTARLTAVNPLTKVSNSYRIYNDAIAEAENPTDPAERGVFYRVKPSLGVRLASLRKPDAQCR
jgi:hypothetical protein